MIYKFRWSFHKIKDLYKKRGLGLWFEQGCLGSTYGEPGTNHFLDFHILIFLWNFQLGFYWTKI